MNWLRLQLSYLAMITTRVVLIVIPFLLLSCSSGKNNSSFINMAHLDYLCEDVTLNSIPATIVHIYCNHPEYQWKDAVDEGIACVDDAARAAVVYMKACELKDDTLYTLRIRRLLKFVFSMQTRDGEFYNFIDKNLDVNIDGRTSRKSFEFWAARGYWALATGYRFFKERDPAFADNLKQAFRKCLIPLRKLMENYQQFENINGKLYPTWLINRYGSDATSEFLLGVAEYLQIENDRELIQFVERFLEGIIFMQVKEHETLAGAFMSWPGYWHAWGNAQVQVLANLAVLLKREDLLQAAEFSARAFLVRLLTSDLKHEYNFVQDTFTTFPQIAYDIRTTVLGFLELYRVTGNKDYAILAGLTGSWLTGNNVLGKAMYDSETGRCYDGLNSKGINLNSGAESTIEALYTLIEITRVPEARFWLWSHSKEISESNSQSNELRYQKIFYCNNKQATISWNPDIRSYSLQTTQMD